MTHPTDRRSFLQATSGAAAATAVSLGVHSEASTQKDIVNVGLIGCGGIMNQHASTLSQNGMRARVSWLCDLDASQIERIKGRLKGPASPQETDRFERVLDDKNVDAVVIATPHHWHVPVALRAMQAGKDVYVEKPISHVFNEGLLMMAAAKKHGRIVQHGTQMRNSPVTKKAEKLLKDGIIGEIRVARAWTAEPRTVTRPVPDTQSPQGVDYDRWLGPAPKRRFNKYRFHSTWRMFRDYANGEIGDDGIHDIDMAVWGLGVDKLPREITARGSVSYLKGHASEYPDNMHVTYEYPDGRLLIYENYPFTSYGLHGFDNGNVFYGTEGYMIFSRRGAFSVFLGRKGQPGPTGGS